MAIALNPYRPKPLSFSFLKRYWLFIHFWTDFWGLRVTLWCSLLGGFSFVWQAQAFNTMTYDTGWYIFRPGKVREGDSLPILERAIWSEPWEEM